MISWPLFFSQVFNGLTLGALLVLVAMGLTIIFGALGVVNFAHGALYAVGAYAGFVTYEYTGSFVAAMAAGAIFLLVVGVVIERGLIRLYYQRPPEDQILVTFGITIVLVEAIRAVFGGLARNIPAPSWAAGIVNLRVTLYPTYRIDVLAIVGVSLVLLYLVLYRTRLGLIVRAGIEDQLMVNILGINVTRTFLTVFGLGAMAAGFAGVINAPIVTVTPDMGADILVQSFVVVVIGGVGSFWGAVVGGLIAGEILSLTAMIQPAYSQVMLFAVMALVLILRPQGLFGVEGRQ
ncbi:MAG: branched-chain amino acid ABC transporter permease [Alphaproteobacteria bacterium]|nr:branched-chain amino acid ABC transporter permease [Alphaproteobacteria bacterium]MDE2512518.1 branched-chain amino acid ABC transporter permease [Alphaproteobacteria bacterium]